MDSTELPPGVDRVLLSEAEIQQRIAELAERVNADYQGAPLLLVGVLNGAMMVMADLTRQLTVPVEIEWMSVSSYGAGNTSSGVVRILKDLDTNIEGRHVLLVEDVLDSGLTLRWLIRSLNARQPETLEVLSLLRKPEAVKNEVNVKYVGFDIPNEYVVGYGMDLDQRYRNLRFIGIHDV